jgi:hypothetical protein
MNKDEYKAAMSKIKASDRFKERAEASMRNSSTKADMLKLRSFAPACAALILVACIGTTVFIWLNKGSEVIISDNASASQGAGSNISGSNSTANQAGDDFKITGESSNAEACYKAIVYIDGYSYSPNSWLRYSRNALSAEEYEKLKGEKLGTVTLDLKGKTYKGTPPSFSSTYNVGTEIYAVKGMKKERAVLVASNSYRDIFYRERKALTDDKKPINLTLSEVFNMITNEPTVSTVELRSEMDGSWMRTSEEKELVKLINRELPKLSLLQPSELGQDPYTSEKRIPINLMFSDGAALHMQVLPETKSASIFGGFVKLSEELLKAAEELAKLGGEKPAISALIPYKVSDVAYLNIINHINGDKILCKTPAWSSEPLYSTLNYYRVTEAEDSDAKELMMTISLGRSDKDSLAVEFYENSDKQIIIKVKDKYYKPVKGQMSFEELDAFLYNFTEINTIP